MLTVASWNVNSVIARKDRLANFLRRVSPDVVCLQELKCLDDKFPGEMIEELGYQWSAFGQKTYNGVAILSKEPQTDVQRGFGDFQDNHSRFIAATVSGVRIISVYVPNGQVVGSEAYAFKLEWLHRLRTYLDRRHKKEESLLICGDFNVAPTDLDVHNPDAFRGQVLFSEQEKAGLQHVLEFGLLDVVRHKHPDERIYSFWDYRQLAFPKNLGWRIDFIFATPSVAMHCAKAWVEREERKGEKPSDHAPVMASFTL